MSIASSFYSALSGMDVNGVAMQVIGDNIANLHTTGFKGSSVAFEDVLGMSLEGIGGSNRLGVGAKVSSMDGTFTQGTMVTTSVGTDVAINGKGFFCLRDENTNEKFYTRAGHFSVNSDGYLVNNQGHIVQGYQYDANGTTLVETLADIRVEQTSMVPPKVTDEVDASLNLDSTRPVLAGGWLITDPGGTSDYSTAIKIYDTLGESHNIQVYFTKTAAQTWSWNAVIDGGDVNGGTAGTPVLYGTGSLAFNASGVLTTAMPVNFRTAAVTFKNGIVASDTDINFTGSTQYGSASAIQTLTQNGYTAGNISGVSINSDGTIVGNYTNGTTKNIAQLALADFTNLYGLNKNGAMLYVPTPKSGEAIYNKPGAGGAGTISSSMLEESNVDLAAEFIKMIITQRGYQANSKVISTVDEMMAQLISVK